MKQSYKYIVSSFLAVALLLPSVSFAQGNEQIIATLMEQIRQLQAQVAALQAQSRAAFMQQANQNQLVQQIGTGTEMETRTEIRELRRTMSRGARGDDVRTLQAVLASDEEVFPEGAITGEFGQMTTDAVWRFQEKHGLTQSGTVDAKTLKKINQLLRDDDVDIIIIRSRTGNTSLICRRTPPGHLVAPGWTRKQNGDREIVPDCQTLPPGILKKLPLQNGTTTLPADTIAPSVSITSPFEGAIVSRMVTIRANATDNVRVAGVQFMVDNNFVGGEDISSPYSTTWNSRGVSNGVHTLTAIARDRSGNRTTSSPVNITVNNGRNGNGVPTTTPPTQDTTAPVIFGLETGSITPSSATVSWMTNEAATTKVYYSTTSPVATNTAPFRETTGLSTFHSVALTQLQAGTAYHLLVVSTDAAGNMATRQTSFTTTGSTTGDTVAPVISNVVSTAVLSTTATVSWTTNEAATTRVYYSTSTPVATGTAPFQEVSGMRTAHSVSLPSLSGGTTYFLLIASTDASGNMTTMPATITTPPLADITPPSVFSIVAGSVGSTTANISWMTSEAATAKVYYGTTNPLLLAGSSVVPVTVFATNQNVNLSGLSPSTTYQFVVVASDTANNSATSSQQSFTTLN